MKNKLNYIKLFEDFQSVAISGLYDTGASGAFNRFKNENPALELEETVNKIKLNPISDEIYNLFKSRNYSDDINKSHLREFIGKDNKTYVISKDINRDCFKVYDVEDVLTNHRKKYIAISNFAIYNDFFSGYEFNDSIEVLPEYRRKGIASAMTDFAEEFYNMPYKPSRLLSDEMKGFVNNRFNK